MYTGAYIAHTNAKPWWSRGGGFDAFKGFPGIPIKNKLNTNVISIGGDLVVFYEGGRPVRVDSKTLNVIGDFGEYQSWHFVNAHPKLNVTRGTYVILDVCYKPTVQCVGLLQSIMRFREYNVTSGDFERECITEISGLVYIHDFVLDEHDDTYTFVKHPLYIDVFKMRGIAGGVRQQRGVASQLYSVSASSGKVLSTREIHHDIFITHWLEKKKGRFAVCYKGVENIHHTKNAVYDHVRNVLTDGPPWIEFPNGGYAAYGNTCHPMEGLLSTEDGSILLPASSHQIVGEPCICGEYILVIVHRHENYLVAKGTSLVVMCRKTHTLVDELVFHEPYVPIGLHGCLVTTGS